MISRIDHISLAVKDFEKARRFLTDILGAVPGARETDETMKFTWEIFSLGDLSRFELITPTGEDSFINGFLKNREGGFHHITLEVPDLDKARELLNKEQIPFFEGNDYGGVWKEIFIHPRDAFGMLVQLSEFNPNDWIAESLKHDPESRWQIKREGEKCMLTLPHPGGGRFTVELEREEAKKLADELRGVYS
jgi:methylmalonyl-CoA/ethylmalonyl-CoA epimerase